MKLSCADCPNEFEYERPVTNGRKGRYPVRCDSCRKERARERDRNRVRTRERADYFAALRLTKFNITKERYEEIIEKQNNLCAVCRVNPPTHIDHDHSCCPGRAQSCGKCVRGVLCHLCNIVLGAARDNTTTLVNAVEYLESSMRL